MYLQSHMPAEINLPDLFVPVRAGVRVESVVLDADGRVQVLVDLDLDDGLFDGVHLPHLGVML